MSNAERRLKNVEGRYLVISTSYIFYRLDTRYLILDTFSNVERRTPSAEYRIEVQCTKYKVQSRDSYLDQNFATKGYACLQERYLVLST